MKLSKSHLTGKEYKIPEQIDDKIGIDSFLLRNKDKKVVLVQGLGFVGSVMSLVCANSDETDYAVIGLDLPTEESFWKICSINEGVFPIISSDRLVEEYYQKTRTNDNFYATYDTYAISKADFIIVDINLDVQKDKDHIGNESNISFDVSLDAFKNAIQSIAGNCKKDSLVLIETTVPPGSTMIAKEIIENGLKQRGLPANEIKIGHSYERVMPGPNYINSIKNFFRVYSGVNEFSANHIENFLKTIVSTKDFPLTRLKGTNSTEISKVLENSYRAMNISFIVEWTRFAEEAGVDIYEVIEAIRMRPTHKNIMLPGIGVGGYCLTKDPLLASWSKTSIMNSSESLRMSELAVKTNDNMPLFAFKFLKNFFPGESLKNKKVLMLGASYAPDIGDTRYSPADLFYDLLKKECCEISVHDPFVKFWEEKEIELTNDFNVISSSLDILVISTGHSLYRKNAELINILLGIDKVFIYDTIGVFCEDEITTLSTKHDVKVIGRGDL